MNKDLLVKLGLVAITFMSACAGGSMGTGVRQYRQTEILPENEMAISEISARTINCTLQRSTGNVRISLAPVKPFGSPEMSGSQQCQAKFLPLSRTLRALVSLNGSAPIDVPYELQMRKKGGEDQWHTLFSDRTTAVSSGSGFALATLPNIAMSAGREYRLALGLSREQGGDALLVFDLGD